MFLLLINPCCIPLGIIALKERKNWTACFIKSQNALVCLQRQLEAWLLLLKKLQVKLIFDQFTWIGRCFDCLAALVGKCVENDPSIFLVIGAEKDTHSIGNT